MLGLFDSGLGGLTVLRRLRSLLPQHDFLFFADQAHVPYGDRPASEITKLLENNVARINAAGADAIVMACNTSCAIAAQHGWPPSRALIIDLIESAAAAVERGGYRRVGVVATAATARTGAYSTRIRGRSPGAQVFEIAAPRLVPLVEAGTLEGPEPREAVKEVCLRLPAGVDAVVLACTHYPLLEPHFRAELGVGVDILDPAVEHAERTATLANELGFAPGAGVVRCITSGDPERFEASVDAVMANERWEACAAGEALD